MMNMKSLPKFNINDNVTVKFGLQMDSGTIIGKKWTYYPKYKIYVWGYTIKWKNQGVGFLYDWMAEQYITLKDIIENDD